MMNVYRPFSLLLFAVWVGFVACSAEGLEPATKALLADAVEQQDAEAIARLLAGDADPNAKQADGMTALHWAVYLDDLDTARQLIDAGADVGSKNRYGVPPLTLACRNGNAGMVALLLKHKADPNTTIAGGETVLMTASRTGRLKAVQALLDSGAKVDVKERRGQSALMWAAAEGHADVVNALLDAGADHDATLDSGFTAFSFAVRNGHLDVVELLLEAGADVNQAMTQARGGRNKPAKNTTPLILAIENGHFELGKRLLEAGADPNDMGTGYSPLHAVSWARKPEIGDNDFSAPPPTGSGKLTSLQFVKELVKHGADVNLGKAKSGGPRRRISIEGTTPFLCAAAKADVEYMKLLLELKADPKLTNTRGQTALMMAAGIGESPEADGAGTKDEHLAAVRFLLDRGADIDAVDKNGETAMHAAAYKSLPRVVHLLAERGADIAIWNKPNKQGRTPLLIAQGFRPGNFKPSAETVEAISKVMLAAGVTPPPPPQRREDQYE